MTTYAVVHSAHINTMLVHAYCMCDHQRYLLCYHLGSGYRRKLQLLNKQLLRTFRRTMSSIRNFGVPTHIHMYNSNLCNVTEVWGACIRPAESRNLIPCTYRHVLCEILVAKATQEFANQKSLPLSICNSPSSMGVLGSNGATAKTCYYL